MASHITMQDALEQSAEEICRFHHHHGFPHDLTSHTGRDAPRVMSHQGQDYEDLGNWAGSVLMYALLFEYGLLRIFDQTGQRASVYLYWGPERQRSSRGQDNDRTNVLESILSVMGSEHGARTQLAWNFFLRYALRHPHLIRTKLLQQALQDPSMDVYSKDDAIAEDIMRDFGRGGDVEVSVKLTLLFNFVREHSATPDYAAICAITGCSSKNSKLKQVYWNASDRFRLLYSADLL